MLPLKSNLHHFPDILVNGTEEFLKCLQDGKSPEAWVIKCSFLSENPKLIQKYAHSGELLFLQTIGAIIPSFYEEGGFSEKAILEQAIKQQQVKNIIVCGNFPSRVIKELVEQSILPQEQLSIVPLSWQHLASSTIELLKKHYAHSDKDELYNIAVQEHVLVQIEKLLQYPIVGKGVDAGHLKIQGWIYNPSTKNLLNYNFKNGQYAPLPSGSLEKCRNLKHLPKRYTV